MNGEQMSDLVNIVFTPSGKRGKFPRGANILKAARDLGVDLDSVCGGRGICGRCQIVPSFGNFAKFNIECSEESFSEFNQVEERYKRVKGMNKNRRLGCNCSVLDDAVIDVPEESQIHKQVIRKAISDKVLEVNPITKIYMVEVKEPDMHHPSGDLERVSDAILEQWGIQVDDYAPELLPNLQKRLREGKWQITVVLREKSGKFMLVDCFAGFVEHIYGLAYDVGSTTISCNLVDLNDGSVLHSVGAMNPQIRFGEDLMSRVSYAMMNADGAQEMTKAVRETLDNLANQCADLAKINNDKIVEIVLVGNPVMHHLLLGLSPVELGWAPFALATNRAVHIAAKELGFNCNPAAEIYILPCIAGHVGADCAGVVLSEAPYNAERITLLVDVGTNAEIVLGNKDKLLACSSPTGPAFEGAQISCGQRAAPGAIERVRIDTTTLEPKFKVIGSDIWSDEVGFAESVKNFGVSGICGSGIIEVIAEMMLAGVITNDGFIDGDKMAICPKIINDGRTFAFVLQATEPVIKVTQNDIRAIQLAKAALYAGCQLLIDKLGKSPEFIGLAGAFGSHIDPKYAMILGMIPDCELQNVQSVGNAAGTGARMALINKNARKEISEIVKRIEKIETAVEAKFQDYFVGAMGIPHATEDFSKLAKSVYLPPKYKKESNNNTERRRRR